METIGHVQYTNIIFKETTQEICRMQWALFLLIYSADYDSCSLASPKPYAYSESRSLD